MAQKVNIILVDDIDESEASETVTFGLDGVTYEIDLNADHANDLREALAVYIGHGRKVGGRRNAGRRSTGRRTSTGDSGASAGEIREWARENGWEVSERGRVPTEVREAYAAAH